MDLKQLDNPGWYALNSHHRHFAMRGNIAARYQPDTLMGAAMPENSTLGFRDLRDLVEVEETVSLLGPIPNDIPGWEIMYTVLVPQMICENFTPAPPIDAVTLAIEDVPDIVNLVAETQLGPFQPRTIELGKYLGIRKDGKLVAMAGERLHLTDFCEISAVCTHQNYRRRGYAGALTTMVAEEIIQREEVPFLHLAASNDVAMRLYKRLGFRLRSEIQLTGLKRLA